MEKRVKWLNDPGKRIVIHFTPYHGSLLNLVEFWFGIMTKQVRLMANLFQQYFDEIPEENWKNLFNAIKLQQEILESSIAGEEGPKKKVNAEKALNHLSAVLEDFI